MQRFSFICKSVNRTVSFPVHVILLLVIIASAHAFGFSAVRNFLPASNISLQDTLYLKSGESTRIDSIRIEGNDITVPDVILRELEFTTGTLVDSAALAYNRERVYSLGIFNHVYFHLLSEGGLNTLIIQVNEAWYIWPVPVTKRTDKDWAKISYGMDIRWLNFRGMNERIVLKFGLGYDPELAVSYNIPYLIRSENISLFTNIELKNRQNKSDLAESAYGEQFSQYWYLGQIFLEKRFDLYNRLQTYFGYRYIETDRYVPRINASGTRFDRHGLAGLRFIHDTRDLAQYPKEGFFLLADGTYYGIGEAATHFEILQIDARYYLPITDPIHTKFRFSLRQAWGNSIPYYDDSFIGLSDRVRGSYNFLKEGHTSVFGSFELFVPIFNDVPFSFKLPLIPERVTTYRLAIDAHLFVETGGTKWNGAPLTINDFNHGFGFGVAFMFLPYNVMRFDIGFNGKGNTDLIIDYGVSF